MKRAWILLLSLVLLLCLAACGETTPTDPQGSTTRPKPTTNAAATDPNHKHDYGKEITHPTCTEGGYTTYTCACGASYVDDKTAPTHSYDEKGLCTLCNKKVSIGLEYTKKSGGYAVSGIGTCRDIDIVIPEAYEGVPVTGIGSSAFSGEKNFRSIVIPESVTSIGSFAFQNCTSLTSIDMPDSVTSISAGAFSGCTSLKSVQLPNNLKSLGANNGLFNPDGPFVGCTSLTSIVIPDSLTMICEYTFANCYSLTNVVIGNGVTEICDGAFRNCSSLESITVGSSVATIISSQYGSAFRGCNNIKEIHISDLTAWCRIDFGNNRLCAGADLYLNGQLVTELVIPDDVINFTSAFQGCTSLTEVTIPDSVAEIEDQAFYDCTNLQQVIIGSGVTQIGEGAFGGCTNLASIQVEENNSTYASQDGILYNKDKTEIIEVPLSITGAVTIPDSVTSIDDSMFEGCTSLIQIENGVSYVDRWVVDCDTSFTHVSLRENTVGIGDQAFRGCSSLTSITIPDSVTSIGEGAFYGCSSLTSITIPDSVTSIGRYAFGYCSSLTSITIPDSVTSIGNSAFLDCVSLTSITVGEHNTVYASQDGILYNKDKTEFIHIPFGLSGSVIIPYGVTSIDRAFYDCNRLTSITIPDSVTSIGDHEFYDCDRLTSITFAGTMEQWNAIKKGSSWAGWTGNYTIYCTDGEIKK